MKADPTRTATLRRRFIGDVDRRFNKLKRMITSLLVKENALGFNVDPIDPFATLQRWRFLNDADKVDAFNAWLKEQVDAGILEVDGPFTPGEPWTGTHVRSAYKKGAVRSYVDVHSEANAPSGAFYSASKAQFLIDAFDSPVAISKLRLLATRSYNNLKGITDDMSAKLGRILADGVAHGRAPRVIAREIAKQIDISKNRARTLARTEVIHAHAEGQLDSLERLGVKEVGALVEWSTAGDQRVCSMCSAMSNSVFTIEEARGLIPRHPNCRCAWLPAFAWKKRAGQKRTKGELTRAKERSAQAEVSRRRRDGTKRTKQERLDESRWVGVDKTHGNKPVRPLRKPEEAR